MWCAREGCEVRGALRAALRVGRVAGVAPLTLSDAADAHASCVAVSPRRTIYCYAFTSVCCETSRAVNFDYSLTLGGRHFTYRGRAK